MWRCSKVVVPRVARASAAMFGATAVTAARQHSDVLTGDRSKPFKIKWKKPDGTTNEVTAYEGQNLLDIAVEHDVAVEAACAGSCACSTCHVYLDQKSYDALEEPSDAEYDMLDMAFLPEPTSRLGCQCSLTQANDGLEATLPKATRNFAVDGFVAMPH